MELHRNGGSQVRVLCLLAAGGKEDCALRLAITFQEGAVCHVAFGGFYSSLRFHPFWMLQVGQLDEFAPFNLSDSAPQTTGSR